MNIEKFEELLTGHLYKSNRSTLSKIASGNPQLGQVINIEFNDFLRYIGNNISKIAAVVADESQANPSIFKAQTKNFNFNYTIHPDKTSTVDIHFITRYERSYRADFLQSKIKTYEGYVYFLKSQYGYKIGCSGSLDKRVKSLGILLPFPVELHSFVKCKTFNKLESFLHVHLLHKRINGEWFNLTESDFNEIDALLRNMQLERILDHELITT